MAERRPTFHYDPSRPAADQVDAALAAARPPRRLRRLRLELALGVLALLLALAVAGPCFLPRGLVAARHVPAGRVLGAADVEVVALPARPAFDSAEQVIGFVSTLDLEPGEPLRPESISATWAAARETLPRGDVLSPGMLELRVGPYVEGGFRDLSPVGRKTRVAIAQGTAIRESMLEPPAAVRIALRDIRPFALLTVEDVARPPPRACVISPVAKGSLVRDSDLVAIDPRYDTLMAVDLANGVARTTPGSPATLVLGTRSLPVQLLQVTPASDGARAVIALAATDEMAVIAAENLYAVQEIAPP
jgi:flagella basal body P-ring formation protein FlgA